MSKGKARAAKARPMQNSIENARGPKAWVLKICIPPSRIIIRYVAPHELMYPGALFPGARGPPPPDFPLDASADMGCCVVAQQA
jgi:hypothetical protein